MILDLTEPLLRPGIDWTSTPMILQQSFDPRVRSIARGLYVLYFENEDHRAVYDKNGDFAKGGEGRLKIHGDGASLKPGKFQGGFIARRRQDADHLHRTRSDPFGRTFRECLRVALVLDLSAHSAGAKAVKAGERLLRRKIDDYLARHKFLRADAKRYGDWRWLGFRMPINTARGSMCEILREVGREIAQWPTQAL